MSKLRVHSFSISLDGYGAGPSQSPDNPLGVGTDLLHDWAISTTCRWRWLHGEKGGTRGKNDDFVARGLSCNIQFTTIANTAKIDRSSHGRPALL